MKIFWFKIRLMVVLLVASTFSLLALDDAVVITNPGVALNSLSAAELKNIYTARTKYWDDGQAIIIVVLPDKTDDALEQASGMDSSQFKTFWERLAFSGGVRNRRRPETQPPWSPMSPRRKAPSPSCRRMPSWRM